MGSLKVRSSVGRRAMFALTLIAMLSSACSSFSPKAEVLTKQVAIDLAFGVKVNPNVVTDEPILRPLEPEIVDLPDPERPEKPRTVEPDLCPPPSALAPKYVAPTSIKGGRWDPEHPNNGNSPPEDKWLFKFSGNRADEPYREEFAYKTIDAHGFDTLPGNYDAFHYRVSNSFNGVNMWFTVVPNSEEIDRAGGTADGLFLRRIEIPRFGASDTEKSLQFSPASAETTGGLRIFNFPIKPGDAADDESAEVAAKDRVPIPGQVVPRTSGNTLTSKVSVGGLTTIPVCDQLARTWKIAWEITSIGEYPWQIAGNFYMGTHIGGWPLKEDFVIYSDGDKVISGNFSSNMARLDPGDYL